MNLLYSLLLDSPADIGGSMDFSQDVSERLLQGVTTLLFGMAVVFSVLIILWAVLKLFKVIFYRKKKEKPAPVAQPEVAPEVKEEGEGADPPAFRVVSFKKH